MNELLKVMNQIAFDEVEALTAILKPFKHVTELMSTETSSSISLIRPLLHQLIGLVKPDVTLNDSPTIHRAKAVMFHDLESRLVFKCLLTL